MCFLHSVMCKLYYMVSMPSSHNTAWCCFIIDLFLPHVSYWYQLSLSELAEKTQCWPLSFTELQLMFTMAAVWMIGHVEDTTYFANETCSECHWNENVFILTEFSSLAAPKVVILTTFGAASEENFVKMMTFLFQWSWHSTQIQYIPRILHTICSLRCFVMVWYRSVLPISFGVTSLTLGQSYNSSSASDMSMG